VLVFGLFRLAIIVFRQEGGQSLFAAILAGRLSSRLNGGIDRSGSQPASASRPSASLAMPSFFSLSLR